MAREVDIRICTFRNNILGTEKQDFEMAGTRGAWTETPQMVSAFSDSPACY